MYPSEKEATEKKTLQRWLDESCVYHIQSWPIRLILLPVGATIDLWCLTKLVPRPEGIQAKTSSAFLKWKCHPGFIKQPPYCSIHTFTFLHFTSPSSPLLGFLSVACSNGLLFLFSTKWVVIGCVLVTRTKNTLDWRLTSKTLNLDLI